MPKAIDITGKTFGKLTVLRRREDLKKYGRSLYECLCECGNSVNLLPDSLKRGAIVSCSLCIVYKNIGKKFGKLTILKFSKCEGRLSHVSCLCDCGNTKDLPTTHVVRKKVTSCGCLRANINKGKAESKLGDKHFRLKVYKVVHSKTSSTLLCKCHCGNKVEIPQKFWRWRKSCGCLQKESVPRGGGHLYAQLTDSEAEAIREFKKSNVGYTSIQLANMFKVSVGIVRRVLTRKTYKGTK